MIYKHANGLSGLLTFGAIAVAFASFIGGEIHLENKHRAFANLPENRLRAAQEELAYATALSVADKCINAPDSNSITGVITDIHPWFPAKKFDNKYGYVVLDRNYRYEVVGTSTDETRFKMYDVVTFPREKYPDFYVTIPPCEPGFLHNGGRGIATSQHMSHSAIKKIGEAK